MKRCLNYFRGTFVCPEALQRMLFMLKCAGVDSFLIFLPCLCKCTVNPFDSQKRRWMLLETPDLSQWGVALGTELTGGHSVMMSWLFTLCKCQQHSSLKNFTVPNTYFLTCDRLFNIYPAVSREFMCIFPSNSFWLLDRLYLLGNNGFDFLSPPSLLYGVEAFDYLLRLGILIAFCETRRAWHIVSLCCTLSCEVLIVWGKKSGKEKWLIRAHAVSEEQNQEPGCILDTLTSDYL